MLRPDAKREYTQDNNMFVTRTQFYAIEVRTALALVFPRTWKLDSQQRIEGADSNANLSFVCS